MNHLGDNFVDKHRFWPEVRVYRFHQQPGFKWSGTASIPQNGRLAVANINNHLTTKDDPKEKFRISVWTAGTYCKQSFPSLTLVGNLRTF
jgi:hypothetical protein